MTVIVGIALVVAASVAIGMVGVVIAAIADAASRPEWAWQQAGQSKTLWVVLLAVSEVVFWIGGLVLTVVYFVSIRPKVRAAQAAGVGAWSFGAALRPDSAELGKPTRPPEAGPTPEEAPAPRQPSPTTTAVAWLFYVMAALAAGAGVLGLIGLVTAPSSRASTTAITGVTGGLAALVFASTGTLLRRRNRRALMAAIIELSLATLLLGAWAVDIAIHPPGPPGTDGAGYAFMGAVWWALLFIGFLILAALPATRRRFGPPPAAWYSDPTGRLRLRWWDDTGWTGHAV